MTTQEEIKELTDIFKDILNPFLDINLDNEAQKMIDDGWHKQIEAEWIPVEKLVPRWGVSIIHHYECSNCKIVENTNNRKYCSNCGAKIIERKQDNEQIK